MRGAISKGGGNASPAGSDVAFGGQGVHREVECEGHEEKYRAVIDGRCPEDELVGQRWGTVEPALWRRRRSHSPTAPRCLQTARYGRAAGDLRRTGSVSGGARASEPISGSEMASEARPVVGRLSSTASAGESCDRGIGDRVGRGRQPVKMVGARRKVR